MLDHGRVDCRRSGACRRKRRSRRSGPSRKCGGSVKSRTLPGLGRSGPKAPAPRADPNSIGAARFLRSRPKWKAWIPACAGKIAMRSLDLGFLELDMLARDRVVLAKRHLLGLVARVLLCHIEKAGVSTADQLDLDGCRLG